MSANTSIRKPAATRTGYAVAAVVNAVLLYLINGHPGWAAVPFLTADLERVLTLLNVSLALGVAVNLVFMVFPAPRVVAAGGVLNMSVGLALLIRLWQVFPFDFGSGWTVFARVLLMVALVGTGIGIVVQVVALVRGTGAGK